MEIALVAEHEPSPFGVGIRAAREYRGLSVRQAAIRAGISEARWRQLENGYVTVAAGTRIAANPRPATVRAMADAVGLDVAEAFQRSGLPIPDDVLARSQVKVDRPSVAGEDHGREPYLSRRDGPDLSDVTTDALLEELAKRARANNPDADR
ncbi:MAG: hypothetical protein JWP11_493 [Frankiales bacterium]|nr:hypothetical protein [Frankiales bacterium]